MAVKSCQQLFFWGALSVQMLQCVGVLEKKVDGPNLIMFQTSILNLNVK